MEQVFEDSVVDNECPKAHPVKRTDQLVTRVTHYFMKMLILLPSWLFWQYKTKLTTNKEKPLTKRTSEGYSRHIFLMHFFRRIELNLLTEQRSDDQGVQDNNNSKEKNNNITLRKMILKHSLKFTEPLIVHLGIQRCIKVRMICVITINA